MAVNLLSPRTRWFTLPHINPLYSNHSSYECYNYMYILWLCDCNMLYTGKNPRGVSGPLQDVYHILVRDRWVDSTNYGADRDVYMESVPLFVSNMLLLIVRLVLSESTRALVEDKVMV